jgi:hypothetical protein
MIDILSSGSKSNINNPHENSSKVDPFGNEEPTLA